MIWTFSDSKFQWGKTNRYLDQKKGLKPFQKEILKDILQAEYISHLKDLRWKMSTF